MKRVFSILAFLIVAGLVSSAVPSAHAAVIFDNFGPGDTYNTGVGWTISSSGSSPGHWDQGDAFTPLGSDYRLDTIELAMWLATGTNELDVWLMSDSSGKPGAVIESFYFNGVMQPAPGSVLLANSVLNPVLLAGTQYWLVASTPGPDTWAAWNKNSTGDTGPHAQWVGGPWGVANDTAGAFRISGTVPEPSTLLLLGSGLAGLGFVRRRLKG
jgi:hypothetical protein